MTYAAHMLQADPGGTDDIDRDALIVCIDACLACLQACTACADACLAEDGIDELQSCISADLDCADLCTATARVLSRRAHAKPDVIRRGVETCLAACRACAEECGRHAGLDDHWRFCADACRACADACAALIATL